MNWSQYIEEDLRGRVSGGRGWPCEPTLERLAAHYRVSTRPVRTALGRLRKQGLLGKDRRGAPAESGRRADRRGGHVKAAARPKSGGQGNIEPPTDYGQAMARELVERSLEGRETFVREQAMARRFGVSTTRVRETFHRLAGEGVIEHVARRGWRLRALSQKDLDDFAAVRQTLECMALRLSWEALQGSEGRAAMERFLAGNVVLADPAEPPRVDDGFHAWIIEAADNRYIGDFFERFGRYYRVLFAWEGRDRAAAVHTAVQHRRILEAILRRDLAGTEKALVEHLRYEHPLLRRAMDCEKQERHVER